MTLEAAAVALGLGMPNSAMFCFPHTLQAGAFFLRIGERGHEIEMLQHMRASKIPWLQWKAPKNGSFHLAAITDALVEKRPKSQHWANRMEACKYTYLKKEMNGITRLN